MDDIDRNNKLNNEIPIIIIEQTAVHHSNRHVFKTRLLMKPLITLFLPLCNLPTFELPACITLRYLALDLM